MPSLDDLDIDLQQQVIASALETSMAVVGSLLPDGYRLEGCVVSMEEPPQEGWTYGAVTTGPFRAKWRVVDVMGNPVGRP